MRATVKWAIGAAKLKTVCFLAVRNADLPAEMNAFCQSLAAILERQLVNSSSPGVLERKRLEFVNQEKNLTPAVESLLASVVTVELQMSRAPQGNGLTVIAFLTDHQGKPIAKLTVQSKEASIPELVGPLLEQIHKTLAVACAGGGR